MGDRWLSGYKVVVKQKTRYKSCSLWRKHFQVYKIGRIARRKGGCGPLGMFETLGQAKRFITDDLRIRAQEDLRIVRCRYIKSSAYGFWFTDMRGDRIGPKGMPNKGIKIIFRDKYPYGTVFADAVEPIKEVVI